MLKAGPVLLGFCLCVCFRWFIGREELKRNTESTLNTFFKVVSEYQCSSYRFNAQKNFIQFENGSRIDLLELKYLPRDPRTY